LHKPSEGKARKVTLIPGIGIGKETTSKPFKLFQKVWSTFLKLQTYQSNLIVLKILISMMHPKDKNSKRTTVFY
jgi:isocitrate/isopropylmalate dehydrogenase